MVCDEPHQRRVEAEHGVAPVVDGVVEEAVADVALVVRACTAASPCDRIMS